MFRLANAALFRLYRITTGNHLPKPMSENSALQKKLHIFLYM